MLWYKYGYIEQLDMCIQTFREDQISSPVKVTVRFRCILKLHLKAQYR